MAKKNKRKSTENAAYPPEACGCHTAPWLVEPTLETVEAALAESERRERQGEIERIEMKSEMLVEVVQIKKAVRDHMKIVNKFASDFSAACDARLQELAIADSPRATNEELGSALFNSIATDRACDLIETFRKTGMVG